MTAAKFGFRMERLRDKLILWCPEDAKTTCCNKKLSSRKKKVDFSVNKIEKIIRWIKEPKGFPFIFSADEFK